MHVDSYLEYNENSDELNSNSFEFLDSDFDDKPEEIIAQCVLLHSNDLPININF